MLHLRPHHTSCLPLLTMKRRTPHKHTKYKNSNMARHRTFYQPSYRHLFLNLTWNTLTNMDVTLIQKCCFAKPIYFLKYNTQYFYGILIKFCNQPIFGLKINLQEKCSGLRSEGRL